MSISRTLETSASSHTDAQHSNTKGWSPQREGILGYLHGSIEILQGIVHFDSVFTPHVGHLKDSNQKLA